MAVEINEITEGRLRRLVRKKGYALRKSRHAVGSQNMGGYRLIDAMHAVIVAGEKFDLAQEDVIAWLNELEGKQ